MKKSLLPKNSSYLLTYAVLLVVGGVIGYAVAKNTQSEVQAKVSNLGKIVNFDASALQVYDQNSAERASAVLSPDTSYVEVNCLDPNGCAVTLDDNAGQKGDILFVGLGTGNDLDIRFSTPRQIEYTSIAKGFSASFVHNGTQWTSLDL